LLVVSLTGAAARAEPPPSVEMKPAAISLDAPPEAPVLRSCVLRYAGRAGMNVLSVVPSAPAILVDLADRPGGVSIVTATLPAGYRGPDGKRAEIAVGTDLPDQPLVHIPVNVRAGPRSHGPA